MRLLTAAVAVALLGCAQPTQPEPVAEESAEEQPAEEPQATPEAEPEPQAEPEEPADEPTPEPAPEPVGEPEEAPEAEPEAAEEPAWQPDAGWLYLFHDEPGGELYFSEQPDAGEWSSRYRAFQLTAEQFGYVFVAGAPPEE